MKNIAKIVAATLLAFASTACNKFLDELPDQRIELDSDAKLAQLLVSAYPNSHFNLIAELSTDNVIDNGATYSFDYLQLQEAYLWQEFTSSDVDTPYHLWEDYYHVVATCNTALQYIRERGEPESLASYKAEALICRAYAHFVLVNMFCQHYNEQTSATDLGIPFMEDIENELVVHYQRGTVKEVYEKINRDIEIALPLLDDGRYKNPGMRFNIRAAHAFAARFNLYYRKDMQKVVDYATMAIGTAPAQSLRDYSRYNGFTTWYDWGDAYVNQEDEWNLLTISGSSVYSRAQAPSLICRRYTHSPTISQQETYGSAGIWQVTADYVYNQQFGSSVNRSCYPKIREYFVVTNPIAQTGAVYNVLQAFTTDEALLCRAEAYAYLGQYDLAMADLTYWNRSHGTSRAVTQALVEELYGASVPIGNTKKQLNPRFDLAKGGFQEALIHCILHTRRVETLNDGLRWFDIKRYGIPVTHRVSMGTDITLAPHDTRCAIQIPSAVIAAGMTPNPR